MFKSLQRTTKVACAIALACTTGQAFAEDSYDLQESLYIYPAIGYHVFDSKRDTINGVDDDTDALSIAFGYQFNQNWGTEVAWGHSFADDVNAKEIDVDLFHLDVLYHFTTDSKTKPFLLAGYGHTEFDQSGVASDQEQQIHLGAGVKHYISEKIALRADVRALHEDERSFNDALVQVGINYALDAGKRKPRDSDADGVFDKQDQCPGTPAGYPVDENGCALDTDNDGVVDGLDKCSDTPDGAKVDAMGCALDSDNDGVADYKDKCPNTPKGTKVGANGCPLDSDNDGVSDAKDKCPNTPKGTKVDANGCSIDSDGDGVADSKDQCSNTPKGYKVDAKGCSLDADKDGVNDAKDKCLSTPAGAKVDKAGCRIKLKEAVSVELNVNFATNSDNLTAGSDSEINKLAAFLISYPDTTAVIEGHTDDRGRAAYNFLLSEKRAKAVVKRLVNDFGIAKDRVEAKGFGEMKPIADNATAEGRKANRRVVAVVDTIVEK